MHSKLAVTVLVFVLFSVFQTTAFSQLNCDGKKLFNEKKCVGDEISAQEKELFRIVNEYRAQNGLAQIPLSEPLSIVANRHLLDLTINIKSISHGWSNCPYDISNQSSWKCVFESPKRLNVNYAGSGYENLYRKNGGAATPALALEAWKKSELHNSLILNLNLFKDTKFDAFGISVSGEYCALWFGSAADVSGSFGNSQTKGLGVTFEKAVSGLTNVVSIKKAASGFEGDQWVGVSPDKSVILMVAGTEKDVAEAAISIKIKLEKNSQLSQKNKNVLETFLGNLASEWKDREIWVDSSLKKLSQNPKSTQSATVGNKVFTMNVDSDNYLSITVKPNKKVGIIEIK